MAQKQLADRKDEDGPVVSRSAAAAYIADLAGEMARLAQREKMEPLGRILRFARDEARRIALEG